MARNLVMLTVGTGVGGGLVLGGRIYRGATGGAGELGHTLIVGLDLAGAVPRPTQLSRRPGSLELVASGHALDRLARAGRRRCIPTRRSARLRPTAKPVLGADAVDAAHEGDEPPSAWSSLGPARGDRGRQRDQHLRSRGGGDRRRRRPGRRAAARPGTPGGARVCRCPASAGAPTIRLARHGVRAGVLGAALLAEHELAGRAARLPRPRRCRR